MGAPGFTVAQHGGQPPRLFLPGPARAGHPDAHTLAREMSRSLGGAEERRPREGSVSLSDGEEMPSCRKREDLDCGDGRRENPTEHLPSSLGARRLNVYFCQRGD